MIIITCSKHIKFVKFQADSPVDPTDKNKTTPLLLTARYGHDKTASLLIEHGADLTHVSH